MKHKKTIILTLILFASILTISIAYRAYDVNRNLLPEEIDKKYACNRITLDARPTDIYCGNYELYKKHKEAGTLVE